MSGDTVLSVDLALHRRGDVADLLLVAGDANILFRHGEPRSERELRVGQEWWLLCACDRSVEEHEEREGEDAVSRHDGPPCQSGCFPSYSTRPLAIPVSAALLRPSGLLIVPGAGRDRPDDMRAPCALSRFKGA